MYVRLRYSELVQKLSQGENKTIPLIHVLLLVCELLPKNTIFAKESRNLNYMYFAIYKSLVLCCLFYVVCSCIVLVLFLNCS